MKELQLTWDKENKLLAQDENGKWWWRDETDDMDGPYNSREAATQQANEYFQWLNSSKAYDKS